ncbi:disulfide isomerase [Micractinium conductrix]|uniref:protein disulfide-isomerase n=1 Tax=Micractinium conductrix TaxID=554055 RepID=A0A2P6VRF6_9CHLO|nr:disulfide isomerase [Micractinium conductrix]|eukprot:PSC76647.1 disulfide isomerase [Micractinium conductrix]
MGRSSAFVCVAALALLAAPALGFYDGGDVTSISKKESLKSLIAQRPALVEFYAPWCGHCKSLKPEWERAATALKGILAVAAVDADANRDLGQEFGVRGFPTIKFLWASPSGDIQSADYNGGRTAQEIAEWGVAQMKKVALERLGAKGGSSGGRASGGGGGGGGGGSCGGGGGGGGGGGAGFYQGTSVVTLTDGDFHRQVVDSDDLWFVEFYAPWCGHCQSLKPAWIDLAKQLGGKVKVGAVDCTAEKQTCDEFQVQGFPTIKFFGENKDSPQDYNGGRDAGSLSSFALERWAAQQPPPEVRELIEEHIWEEFCIGHAADADLDIKEVKPKQLCLVAFLPHILDSKAAGREAYLEILRGLTAKYKDRPFSYFWAEGGTQPELEANFGVGGYGYPALIAFNPSKSKYANLKSAFEDSHVKQFLESVRLGFESVADVSGTLAPVQSRDPWDGGEGSAEMEDEFDLADLMGEEVEAGGGNQEL